MAQIVVHGIPISITRKRVKHLRIVVNRRNREVRISSPWLVSRGTVVRFAESNISWIKKQLAKAESLPKEPEPSYTDGETHYLWGQPYTLRISKTNRKASVEIRDGAIMITTRKDNIETLLVEFYREEIKQKIPGLIKKWEPVMDIRVNDWGVKKMKTRWGTCNTSAGRIWLNLHLAKKDPKFLEYIVVHEMVHLLERLHSRRFYALMDHFLPGWRETDKQLGGRHWKKFQKAASS